MQRSAQRRTNGKRDDENQRESAQGSLERDQQKLQIGAGRSAFPNTFSFLIQDRLPPLKGVWIFLLFTFKARTKVVRIAKALKLHVLNKLPFWWMALVVSVVTYLVAGVIFAIITALASGERVR